MKNISDIGFVQGPILFTKWINFFKRTRKTWFLNKDQKVKLVIQHFSNKRVHLSTVYPFLYETVRWSVDRSVGQTS